jgi:hypothetical protein
VIFDEKKTAKEKESGSKPLKSAILVHIRAEK